MTAAGFESDPTDIVGKRVVQYIIDVVIMSIAFVVPYFILMFILGTAVDTVGGGTTTTVQGGAAFLVWLISLIIWAVVWLGNWVWLQGTKGQSVGMMVMKIQVVMEDGSSPPGAGPAFIRNILLIVDGLFCGLIGLILMLTQDGHRRLGDMAAKTYVVGKEHVGLPPAPAAQLGTGGYAAPPPQAPYQQAPPPQAPHQQAPPPQAPPPQAPPPPDAPPPQQQ